MSPVLQPGNEIPDDGLSPLERVLSRLQGVRKAGGDNQYSALCPSHTDHRPSLSVGLGRDGKRVVMHCHKGCEFDVIMESLGLPPGAAFPDNETESCPAPVVTRPLTRVVDKTYDYVDEAGNLLFQTVRYKPKDFSQRHLCNGQWVWNLNGTRRVLYRLPDVLNAADDEVIYVVEGEKDADALAALGLTATCNPLGAGKWRAEYNQWLRGRHVAIIPDNDETGRRHAEDIAQSLLGVANTIRVIELPDVPTKGDVTDWVAQHSDLSELEILVATCAEYQADPDDRFLIHNFREAFEPRPPMRWIIQDLLSIGSLIALVGDAGTKKTWLALYLAVCVAAGVEFLGREVEQGVVLIIDEESGHNRLCNRVQAIAQALDIQPPLPLYWITMSQLDLRSKEDMERIKARIEMLQPKLVIVDALMEVIAGADENSGQEVMPAIKTWRGVGQRFEFASLMIHHANRRGSYRGHSSIKGVVDGMLMVDSTAESAIVRITTEKLRDTEPVSFSAEAHFEGTPARRVWFESADQVPNWPGIKGAVISAFTDGDADLSRTEIIKRVQASVGGQSGTIANAITSLLQRGALRRLDKKQGRESFYERA